MQESNMALVDVEIANRQSDLIRALAEAESSPTHHFVALKWFRDDYLTRKGPAWADAQIRTSTLNDAIAAGLIETAKIHNPKQPEYPTTTLKLVRSHPDVKAVLGAEPPSRFPKPYKLRGELFSETLLRDRGEY
ncbi:MAG: hypothetical protein SFV18_12405 [Bryobacteraceae bacterium]|nr:hypothetical protein [Bryobacteraceae bacterium]